MHLPLHRGLQRLSETCKGGRDSVRAHWRLSFTGSARAVSTQPAKSDRASTGWTWHRGRKTLDPTTTDVSQSVWAVAASLAPLNCKHLALPLPCQSACSTQTRFIGLLCLTWNKPRQGPAPYKITHEARALAVCF